MWKRLGLGVALLVIAAPAHGETADGLVAKHVEARGGLARLKAIKTVRIERTVAATFTDIEMRIVKKRPGLYRSDQTPKGSANTIVRGFGEVAWEQSGGKTTLREDAAAAEQREADADFDGFLVEYRAKGHAVEYEGMVKIGGLDAHKLKVTLRSGAVRYVYLDAATYLDRRHETTMEIAPGRRVATTITFGDWREIQGVLFPFAVEEERDAPGQTFVHYTSRVEVNVPVDDSLFTMPHPPL